MGIQRPLGQAKKGVGHFVFPLPGRVTEKWQVEEERNRKLNLYCNIFQEEFPPKPQFTG